LASTIPPAAVGSVIMTEPMMSNCHSCIGPGRSTAGNPLGDAYARSR
jgi:hypothetical protein